MDELQMLLDVIVKHASLDKLYALWIRSFYFELVQSWLEKTTSTQLFGHICWFEQFIQNSARNIKSSLENLWSADVQKN